MGSYSVILLSACCILAALHVGLAGAEKARFDNYRIYSVKISNEVQLRQLQDIDRHLDGVSASAATGTSLE